MGAVYLSVAAKEIKAPGVLDRARPRGIIADGARTGREAPRSHRPRNLPMPDPRSVMKEFRFLDQKRLAEGLTPDEEARLGELRDLVGPDPSAGASRAGFDVGAAAARLRESLLPAGLRNRPPPDPEPAPEPLGEVEIDPAPAPAAAALEEAYAAQPFAGLDPAPGVDPLFDPSSLGLEPDPAAYDPAAGYAPDAAYDPNAYDSNGVPYDPSAAGYDPNAPYDPNAAAYDPNAAAYDPNAAAYDPNAVAYDPASTEAPGAGWDSAPADSSETTDSGLAVADGSGAADEADWSGVSAALDDDGPELTAELALASFPDGDTATLDSEPVSLDDEVNVPAPLPGEGEEPAWAPSPGGEYDAAAWDAGEATSPGEPELPAEVPAPSSEAALDAYPPDGWSAPEPLAAPREESGAATGFGDYDASRLAAEAAELATLLPFDPAAASAIGVDALDAFAPDTREAYDEAHTPGDELGSAGFHAAPVLLEDEAPDWQPEPGAVDQGFQLASGGSFDAAADAAAPEWATPGAEPMPWDAETDLALPGATEPTAGAAAPQDGSVYAGGDLAGPDPYEDLPPGAPVALDHTPADFSADGSGEPDLAWAAPGELPAVEAEPLTSDPYDGFGDPEAPGSPGSDAPPAVELGAPDELFAAAPPAEVADQPFEAEAIAEPELPAIPDAVAMGDLPEATEELETLDADALEELPVEALEPELTGELTAPPAMAAEAEPWAPPEAQPWEAAPAPEAAPAEAEPWAAALPEELPVEEASVEPAAGFGYGIPGAHRVVVHTLEGQVKRGVISDADLSAGALDLASQAGGVPEIVPTDHVKAIFFMLAPGEHAPAAEGKRVRVTFRDGRQVAGLSPDYHEDALGFFMFPADARTSTSRIWVYQAAVRQVTVS